jgi:hypothetical protein
VSARKPRGFDIGQLRIDWPTPGTVQATSPAGPSDPRPATAGAGATAAASPALRLRWDFRTRFPQPTDEAIDAGQIEPEEAGPESVRAIHDAHAAELLGVLRDLDAEAGARRGIVASSDNGAAATLPDPERSEPSRLRRWYANLLGIYGDLFGPEAAEAFDQAVRAWHAHVEVVVENGSNAVATVLPSEPEPIAPSTAIVRRPQIRLPATVVDPVPAGPESSRTAEIIAAGLPVPRPLPEAVAAGHFGHEEDGQPIRPSADEVRDITEAHAELLTQLVAALNDADRRRVGPTEVDRRVAKLRDAVRKCAEDFGEGAAEQLLAYARREVASAEPQPVGRGR